MGRENERPNKRIHDHDKCHTQRQVPEVTQRTPLSNITNGEIVLCSYIDMK